MSLPNLKDVSPGAPRSCRAAVGNCQIQPARSVLKDKVNLPKENPRSLKCLEKIDSKNDNDGKKLCASKKLSLLGSLKPRRYSTGEIGSKVSCLSEIPKMDTQTRLKDPLNSTYVCKDPDIRNKSDDSVNIRENSIVLSEGSTSSSSTECRTFVVLDDDGNDINPDSQGPKARFGSSDDDYDGCHAEAVSAVLGAHCPFKSLMINMGSTESLSTDHQLAQEIPSPAVLSSFFFDCNITNSENQAAGSKYFSTPVAAAKAKTKMKLTPVIEAELELSSLEASSTTKKNGHHSKMESGRERNWCPQRLQLVAPGPEELSLNTPLYHSFFATECLEIASQLEGGTFGERSPDANAETQSSKRKWGMFDVSTIDAETLPFDSTPMKSMLAFEAGKVAHSLESSPARTDQSMFGGSILDLDHMDLQLMDSVVFGEVGRKHQVAGKETVDSERSVLTKMCSAPADNFKNLKDLSSFEGFDILGVALDESAGNSAMQEGADVCDRRVLATTGLNCTVDINAAAALGALPRDPVYGLLHETVTHSSPSYIKEFVPNAELSPSHTVNLDELSSDGQDVNLTEAFNKTHAIMTAQDANSEVKILNLVNPTQDKGKVCHTEQAEGSMKVVVNTTHDIERGQVDTTREMMDVVSTTQDIDTTNHQDNAKVECSVTGNTTHEIDAIRSEANPEGEVPPKAIDTGLVCNIGASSVESKEMGLHRAGYTLSYEESLVGFHADVEPGDCSRKRQSFELPQNDSVFSNASFMITSTPLPGNVPFQFMKSSSGDSMLKEPSLLQKDPNVSMFSNPEELSCDVAVTDQTKSTVAKKGGNRTFGKPGTSNTTKNSIIQPSANSSQRSLFRTEIPSKATLQTGLPTARRSLALTSAIERPRVSKENSIKPPTGGRSLHTMAKTSKSALVNSKTQIHKQGVVTNTLTSLRTSPTNLSIDIQRTSLASIGEQESKKEGTSPSSNPNSKPAQIAFQGAATQSTKQPSMMKPPSNSKLYKFTGKTLSRPSLGTPRTTECRSSRGGAQPSESRLSLGGPRAPESRLSLEGPRAPESRLSLGGPRAPESRLSLGGPRAPESTLSLGGPRAPESRMSLGAPRAPDSRLSLGAPRAPNSRMSMGAPRAPDSRMSMGAPRAPGSRMSMGAPRAPDSRMSMGAPRAADSRMTMGPPRAPDSRMSLGLLRPPASKQSIAAPRVPDGKISMGVSRESTSSSLPDRRPSLSAARGTLSAGNFGIRPPAAGVSGLVKHQPYTNTPPGPHRARSPQSESDSMKHAGDQASSEVAVLPSDGHPAKRKSASFPAPRSAVRSGLRPPMNSKTQSLNPSPKRPRLAAPDLFSVQKPPLKLNTGPKMDTVNTSPPTTQKPRIGPKPINATPPTGEKPRTGPDSARKPPATVENTRTGPELMHKTPTTDEKSGSGTVSKRQKPSTAEKQRTGLKFDRATPFRILPTEQKPSFIKRSPATGTMRTEIDTTHRTPKTEQPMSDLDTIHSTHPNTEEPVSELDTIHRTSPNTEEPMSEVHTTHRTHPNTEEPMSELHTTHITHPNTEEPMSELHTTHRTHPNTEPMSELDTIHRKSPNTEEPMSEVHTHRTHPNTEEPISELHTTHRTHPNKEPMSELDTIHRKSPNTEEPMSELHTTHRTHPNTEEAMRELDTIHRTHHNTEEPRRELDSIHRTSANAEEPMSELHTTHGTHPNTEEPMRELDTIYRTHPNTEEPITERDTITRTPPNTDESITKRDTIHRRPPATKKSMFEVDATQRTPPNMEAPIMERDLITRTPPNTEEPINERDTITRTPSAKKPMSELDTTHRIPPSIEQPITVSVTVCRTPPNTEEPRTHTESANNTHGTLFYFDSTPGVADISARDETGTNSMHVPVHHPILSKEPDAAQGVHEGYLSPVDSASLLQTTHTFEGYTPFQDCLDYQWNVRNLPRRDQELEEVKRELAVRDVQCEFYVLKLKALEAQCEDYQRQIHFLMARRECPNIELGMHAPCEEVDHPLESSSMQLVLPLETLSEEVETLLEEEEEARAEED